MNVNMAKEVTLNEDNYKNVSQMIASEGMPFKHQVLYQRFLTDLFETLPVGSSIDITINNVS